MIDSILPRTSHLPPAGSRDGRTWPPPPPPQSEARSARRAAVPIQQAVHQAVNQEAAEIRAMEQSDLEQVALPPAVTAGLTQRSRELEDIHERATPQSQRVAAASGPEHGENPSKETKPDIK